MLQEQSDVKAEMRVVGIAKYPVFETVDELLNDPSHGMSEPELLRLINAQVKTNAMNTVRTNATKGPTKGWLRAEATNEVFEMLAADPGLQTSIRGDRAALDKLITDQEAAIAERMKNAAPIMADDSED